MAAKPQIVENSNKFKDSAVRIKDSAAHMERSTARVEDGADRRTDSRDRTIFAADARMPHGCTRVLFDGKRRRRESTPDRSLAALDGHDKCQCVCIV